MHALPAGASLQSGQFIIKRVLGQGGFGITYLGDDTRLNRAVAIKEFFPQGCVRQGSDVHPSGLLAPAEFGSAKDRFLDEARNLARFHHPGIVNVHTFFEENNTACMVMEYLHGQTLLQVVQGCGALPETEACGLIEKAGEALAVVHAANLIHRDIKPANIMRCDDGRIVLIDFGLIKQEMTAGYGTVRLTSGMATGTSGYAPPEQYTQHGTLGAPTDIYALAATLYHLLTGEVPVAATDRALGGADLPEPRRLRPSLSRAANDALMRALSLKANERPQTVRAFLDALAAPPAAAPSAVAPAGVPAPPTIAPAPAQSAKSTFTPPSVHPPAQPAPLRTAHQIATTTPVQAQARTTTAQKTAAAPKPNGWGWAAFAFAVLAFFWPGLRLWVGAAAVLCGLISWVSMSGLRWNSLAGMIMGGWFAIAALSSLKAPHGSSKSLVPAPRSERVWQPGAPGAPGPGLPAAPRSERVWQPKAPHGSTKSSTLSIGSTKVNPKDGAEMVYVPAGEFLMGSNESEDEKPQRRVYLDGYWMYKTEVTVAQYRRFCTATERAMPEAPRWGWKEDHPIVNVDWDDAQAYCDWAGASLPSEAQWEKAARGTDGRVYPWGNKWDATRLQANSRSTTRVGFFRSGASPYGALDMAGNVWEWCGDWYDGKYYANAPERNPTGPTSGQYRVLRGGSWGNLDPGLFRSASRIYVAPVIRGDNYGFRCVQGRR